ncbi:hypothetical protein H8L32_00600 [Undibacterium sp. CY18W]|uniref:Sigma-E factor negative regulatory protein RseA n=1 Tax=Undibacterium hunanense TaxID=2762292 RepID=A0ABR6ZJ82_9BURK|nr:hypothetical protein [Undibacterium hunanense]MBC3915970.1 hypothetical protein [Undibacterium hunanense]
MTAPENAINDAGGMETALDTSLDRQFSILRADLQQLHTPAATEQILLQAFAKQQAKDKKQARARRWRPWLAGMLTLGGSLGLFMMTILFPAHLQDPSMHNPAYNNTDLPPFIALVPLERLNNETPHMLEAEVPAAWLTSLGMPVSPEMAGDLVQAQMLVGDDGEPLAMRLLKY